MQTPFHFSISTSDFTRFHQCTKSLWLKIVKPLGNGHQFLVVFKTFFRQKMWGMALVFLLKEEVKVCWRQAVQPPFSKNECTSLLIHSKILTCINIHCRILWSLEQLWDNRKSLQTPWTKKVTTYISKNGWNFYFALEVHFNIL